MGRFKLGEQVCNNCIHWKCNDKREFQGNPPREVYTCVNCADCGRTGRSQHARDTCPFFAHIGGVTVTFPSESTAEKTATSASETSPGESYYKAVMASIQNRRAMQASDANSNAKKQQMSIFRDDDVEVDDEASREFRRRGEDLQHAQERVKELMSEGLDPACMLGDKSVEFMHLLDRARDGDAEDQKRLAFAFWNGEHGAEEDHFRAACWFGKASDEDPEARFMRGCCYVSGVSGSEGIIAQDVTEGISLIVSAAESGNEEAKEWIIENASMDPDSSDADKTEFLKLLKAANGADTDKQYELAVALALGRRGARKDRTQAIEWYKKSAKAGKPEAMVALADRYKDGEVEGKDINDAIGLYKKAAVKGDWRAQHVLAELYSSGESVTVDYAEAIKWALLAADNDGTADVFSLLGKCYENGLGTEKDAEKAFKYYQKAAQKDNDDAKAALIRIGNMLGDCLYGDIKFGPGAPDKDKDECRKIYSEAMEGRPGAEYEMGNILSKGMYCVLVNKKESFAWYLKSAEDGFADAQYEVARFYSLGEKDVVDCNDEKGFKWYWEAATQGHVEAMQRVADCFYYGSGISEDDDEAKMWYVRAAKAGDDTSLKMLKNHWKLSDDALHELYGIITETPAGMSRKADESEKSRFRELQEGAKRGDAEAQFRLGHAFVYGGDGAKMNEHHGVMWLKKAAAQENAEAAKLLGDCYRNGWGVEEDVSEAFRWYKKAAEYGDEQSCFKVGYAYYFGKGLEEDEEEAFKWFARAAEKGHAEAQCRLAECYLMGNGIVKDLEKAREWYLKSAEQGDALAQFNLAKIYYFGKGIEKDFDEAFKWFKKAAEQDRADAQVFLGTCYRRGLGVEKDFDIAFDWYSKSAEGDNAEAQFWIGKFYVEGWGKVAKDYAQAIEWYEKSAAQDNTDAICALGWCYQLGNGVERDLAKAVKWFQKGTDLNDGVCMNNLARLIEDGQGAEQDYGKALALFKNAAENNCSRANYHIGRFYENGLGCAKNIDEAKEWYQKAADKGDKDAKAALERLG